MKKHLLLVATALYVTCVSSFAQDGAMKGAAAPAVSQASVEAAMELMRVMQMRETWTASMTQTANAWMEQTRSMTAERIRNEPRLDAKQKQEALAKSEEVLLRLTPEAVAVYADPKAIDDIVTGTAMIYARTFSLDELRQLAAFNKTPIGQKFIAFNPKLSAEMGNLMSLALSPRLNQLALKMSQELKLY